MNRRTNRLGCAHKVRTRDPGKTQERILAAALKDFSAKGLSGARVDAIARRAGVNKRMLYHYFGNKNGLFSAVLRQKLAQREVALATAPEDPADLLVHWYNVACNDPHWFRLLEWEALQTHGNPVHEGHRRAILQQAVERMRQRQAKGLLPAELDPQQLLLSFMALSAYPFAFPQLTWLVTGQSATDPAFQKSRYEFLRRLAGVLCAGAKKQTLPKQPVTPEPI